MGLLDLAKWVQRYLNFSALKRRFLMIFCNFLGINTHKFVKSDPKLGNKGLFHAKFYGA